MEPNEAAAKSISEMVTETSAKTLAARATQANAPRKHDDETPLNPSELWTALTAIPRPTRKVPFPRNIPGTQQPIGFVQMWPLTQDEQHAANASADRFAKELMKDPQRKEDANLGYYHAYTNDLAIQVIYRACRDVNDIERAAFPSPKLLRQHLTTDEAGVLFAKYCTMQAEIGPIRAKMTKQEYEALIIRIAEGGSADPLDSISLEQRKSLTVFLASRLVACWTAMSVAGLQLDASTFALELLSELEKAKAAALARGEEPELLPDIVEPEEAPEEASPTPTVTEG